MFLKNTLHHHRDDGNSNADNESVWMTMSERTRTQAPSEHLNPTSGLSGVMTPAANGQMYDPMWRSSEDGIMDAFGARGSTWESFTKDGPNDGFVNTGASVNGTSECSKHDTVEGTASTMRHEWEKQTRVMTQTVTHPHVVSCPPVLQKQYFNVAANSPCDVESVVATDMHTCVQRPPSAIENHEGPSNEEPSESAVQVETGVAPRAKAKRIQVCYKCGAEGHHPATCHVDVQYVMCELHGRRRSEKNLYYDAAMDRYQCHPEYQCKTSETRVNNKHATAAEKVRNTAASSNTTPFPMAQQPPYLHQQHAWMSTPQMHAIMPGALAAPYVVSMMPHHPSLHPPSWPATMLPWGGMYGGGLALPVPLETRMDHAHGRMPGEMPMTYVPTPYIFNPFGLGRDNGQPQ